MVNLKFNVVFLDNQPEIYGTFFEVLLCLPGPGNKA